MAAMHWENYATTVECFDRSLFLEADDDYLSLLSRGLELDQSGQYHFAINVFNRVLEIYPESFEAWRNRGIVLEN